MKKKTGFTFKAFLIILLILAIAGIIFYFATSQTQFVDTILQGGNMPTSSGDIGIGGIMP